MPLSLVSTPKVVRMVRTPLMIPPAAMGAIMGRMQPEMALKNLLKKLSFLTTRMLSAVALPAAMASSVRPSFALTTGHRSET